MSTSLPYPEEREALLEAMQDHYDRLCIKCEGLNYGCIGAKHITMYKLCNDMGMYQDKEAL